MEINIGERRITVNVGSYTFMPVPVQFGHWSKTTRKVKILESSRQAEGDIWFRCQIAKGEKGAGRKFWLTVKANQ